MTTNVWSHVNYRWWEQIDCDGLFLLFDTSAHINNGTPDVSDDEALEHLSACETCREEDYWISLLSDGTAQIEPLN